MTSCFKAYYVIKSDIMRIMTREWGKKQKRSFGTLAGTNTGSNEADVKDITCVREVFGSGVSEEAAVAGSKCGYLIDF